MLRIGHGYDAHRLVPGRRMILGGVDVPHHLGLDGHSDADVLTHAVMDALLGALSLGDIGLHFPPGDAAFAGADSIKLLQKVVGMIKEQGFSLCNLDATIIAQKPKLAGHIPKMRENLAAAIGVPVGLCSVKATTEEGMGFTGREEGVAAHCVLLLAKENRENKRPV
ncbi:MAG: 2-C-methyl-D-erythritol 2,4-cyclodiphosphate synthase [Oscillospiraceae bacterium]|nr:2-C-methyl-D-erythritol 2,4-cyclodiphosphate synthase [Oscillospiraceae bacterium]